MSLTIRQKTLLFIVIINVSGLTSLVAIHKGYDWWAVLIYAATYVAWAALVFTGQIERP
jgi:hypothetical protein